MFVDRTDPRYNEALEHCALDESELHWQNKIELFEQYGYKLPPRYHPGWKPTPCTMDEYWGKCTLERLHWSRELFTRLVRTSRFLILSSTLS